MASVSERFTQPAMDLGTLAAMRLSDSPSAVRLTENYQKSIVLRKKILKGRFLQKKPPEVFPGRLLNKE